MDERREVSGASEEASLSGGVIEPPPWCLYDNLPYPRVVFPILTAVAVGYAMLISANPHWAGDLIDVFFAGK